MPYFGYQNNLKHSFFAPVPHKLGCLFASRIGHSYFWVYKVGGYAVAQPMTVTMEVRSTK